MTELLLLVFRVSSTTNTLVAFDPSFLFRMCVWVCIYSVLTLYHSSNLSTFARLIYKWYNGLSLILKKIYY